ncbi:MAG: polysaccharide pyruvyl transferase family protein [Bacteroidetes bacterium]|uniref:Polysaccharide pyruvyl transferase family protein n=1 Tax=Candidatus Cryptobacteroides intestinigallinarum TaxID=2840767 RepID=A0A9D9HJK9_9BACT|nr:polysaccharide pyruvyl transferase family protein [Candidatus Cryptobacteroides intestinigallinarum]
MKTGIITFHAAINYGSVLQAFALQEYLTARGHDVSVIDFRSKAQRQLYPSAISFSSRYNAKRTLSRIMRPFSGWKEIRMTATKHSAFSSFLERYLHQTPEKFFAEEDLRRYDWSSYGMLVSGSDQIWNLSAIDASPAYFLDFVSGMKKIAYAPSAGPHPVSSGRAGLGLSQARKFISDYSAVSVREKATADFYSLGDAPVLPDPTVLHEADFYRSAECPLSGISLPERYVLYYAPGRRSKAAEMLADAASAGMLGKKAAAVLPQQARIPVLSVGDGASCLYPEFSVPVPCGPDGFLYLVDKASCTVGTSYHLMVFSMLFGKDFWCPDAASDSRKVQLLSAAGLSADNTFFPFSDPEVKQQARQALLRLRAETDAFWDSIG